MDTSKIIKGVVSNGRYTVTAPIVKEDYGLYLKIEGVELPETYQVDFSNSENSGTSVTMIGNSDGVLIPHQFIDSGKDVFAFLYHVGADFGRTVYKFRIPNKVRPDRTNEEPTPEEQSTIDQVIASLNDAVDRAEDAEQAIEDMSVSATTLAEGESATVTKTESEGVVHLEFGIPRGATGAQGERGEKGDKGDTGAQGIQGIQGERGLQGAKGDKGDKGDTGATGAKGDKGDKGDTGAQGIQGEQGIQGIQGEKGEKGDKGEQGDDYVLTEQDKQDIADIAEADLTPTILNAFPTDIASGSIASFTDGADDLPLKLLVVNIDPVQDLHGQDAPYPAGGGKNQWDEEWELGIWDATGSKANNSNAIRSKGYIPVSPQTEYYLYIGTRYTAGLVIRVLDSNKSFVSTITFNQSKAFTIPSGGAFIVFCTYASNNITVYNNDIAINYPSTVTTYSPYENICPISGWTGMTVNAAGKNLFDVPASVTKGYITFTRDSDGYVTANPNNADSRSWGKDNAQFLVNLAPGNYKFVIKLKTPSASQYSGWEIYSPTGVKIAGSSGGKFQADEVAAFTASTYGTYYIMAKIHSSAARFMVVKDGADTSDYAPYTGQTIPISWQTEAGTVYGGTLDVTTGKLTVDRAMVDLGAKNWYPSTAAGRTRFRTSITDIERISSPNVRASLLCSNYPTKTANQTYQGTTGVSLQQNSADIYIYDPQTESMTTAEFKSAMSGVQLCYELATPQTYQLTPTEVATLLGDNTIWADTGDTEVEYRANTKLYIERLTAPDSADMIADANITSGQYFMVGNSLYKATANIANGSAIVVGTNCTRKSLSEALNEINA